MLPLAAQRYTTISMAFPSQKGQKSCKVLAVMRDILSHICTHLYAGDSDRHMIIDIDERKQRQQHETLAANIDEMLATARPRLLRHACGYGVTLDAADDVVQETLIEAWRHLHQLRTPDRFDAWLDGICHNVCRRWSRTQGRTIQRQVQFSSLQADDHYERYSEDERLNVLALSDESTFDPAEELSRQDLAILLDRALGYLTPDMRKALEMCYLAELPQREAAQRLGLTINTLEVRLHRARRQLFQILNRELRADAREFGLAVDQDTEAKTGWSETRLWCIFCGRHRFRGILEPLPDGRVNLRYLPAHPLRIGNRRNVYRRGLAAPISKRNRCVSRPRIWRV